MAEARDLIERLATEEAALRDQGDGSAARDDAARAAERALAMLNEAEQALADLTARVADLRAERRQFEAQLRDQSARAQRFSAEEASLSRQLAELQQRLGATSPVETLRADLLELDATLAEIEEAAQSAESASAEARQREKETRDAAGAARLKAKQLETEIATLVKLLKPSDAGRFKPIVDEIKVASGYEIALGAALGDDLDIPADGASPTRWSYAGDGAGDAPLPAGAEPLAKYVTGPRELARRLRQVGVVARGDGERLKTQLLPGQRLVSREGDLWRWDGLTAAANAPTAAAKRLAERNRLAGLEAQLDELKRAADAAEADRQAAQDAAAAHAAEEKRLREAWRSTQDAAARKRTELAQAERAAMELSTRLTGIEDAIARAAEARAEAETERETAQSALDAAQPIDAAESELTMLRERVAERRAAYTEAKAALDGLDREARLRNERLRAIQAERDRWLQRSSSAKAQMATLEERLGAIRSELADLASLPQKVAERRNKLLNEIGHAEAARKAAADQLAAATETLREADRALREAQANLASAREAKARIEARLEAARERRGDHARLIRETFECHPGEVLAAGGVDPNAPLPDSQAIEQQIVKLRAERERLGGVNLRAEEEASQLSTEFDGLETERADLQEAVGKLRQGIANLNREGRKRLLEAFETVNGHFQRLFKVLFGGGEAELQLIESDDPLESGLELLCRPPGKKPQVLTLLSGGEKALTALALIFAVFLTNPSPICVLDEVDAPLDDANVERFCRMMEEMARTTNTRFLVITHHPMTMSRMNRLFGVTMVEKGVSQLVSVDLQAAERFREAS